MMITSSNHQLFGSTARVSQSLRNDRCQNILYKAVFEHFKEIRNIAAFLLTSKSFQNSSFGANFLVNFIIEKESIQLLDSVLSPSSCFSLQFAPSLHIKQSTSDSEKRKRGITNFVREIVKTKYLKVSLRSLKLDSAAFEVVSFFFGNFSNAWPQLLSLHLENCVLGETVLKAISKNAVNLRIVNFSSMDINFANHFGITDSLLEHISKLSGITSLNLAGCRITDAGLERVATLSGITSLNLACCDNITDAGLERVSKLDNITSLNLSCCDTITDAGLESVSKLSRITSLNLAGCSITDAGVELVTKLSSITSLGLAGCRGITDAGLEHLAKLSDITSLDLSSCSITDAGLLLLAKLSNINSLNLSGRNITDAGLEHIANLPSITYLNLYNSTFEARNKLAVALPNCWIGHDQGWVFSDCEDERPLRRPRQSVN